MSSMSTFAQSPLRVSIKTLHATTKAGQKKKTIRRMKSYDLSKKKKERKKEAANSSTCLSSWDIIRSKYHNAE